MATSRSDSGRAAGPPFRRVLVANRGEIAVRVMRACRELGVEAVAVYSEPDRTALHVRQADLAYAIGPAPASESYLRIDKLLAVARESGAEAVHPGYGFLAERAAFARACAEAGVVFIGPSAEAIEAMGDKLEARRRMIAAGVPVVPGSEEPVESDVQVERLAAEFGFPVMLKAAGGGGGKGLRLVGTREELKSALRGARSEARSAFGDDRVYVEKAIVRQPDVVQRAGAIECRIYAEDPANNFLPAPGRIEVLRVPSGIGIRDDSGVYEGFEVSTFYDPMISKLIAWGSNRDEAIDRMLRALAEYTVVGPVANIAFHRWALEHPAFRAGDIDTGFIARHFRPAAPDAAGDLPVIGAAIAAVSRLDGAAARPGAAPPGLAPSRWRTLARREALRE